MNAKSESELADEHLDRVLGALFRRLVSSTTGAEVVSQQSAPLPQRKPVDGPRELRSGRTLEQIIDDISLRLADLLEARTRPVVPLSVALWDIATIAVYLKRDPDSVRERIACLPDFPRAIRLPSTTKRGAHPLYKAAEVIAWAEGYQCKAPSAGRKRAQIARDV